MHHAISAESSQYIGRTCEDTVKHLMFAWDLFREFRDSLKITKNYTSELEKIKKFKQKNRIYMYLHYYVY